MFTISLKNFEKLPFNVSHYFIFVEAFDACLNHIIFFFHRFENNLNNFDSEFYFLFAGILRYKVDFQSMQLDDMDNLDFDLDDY